MINNIVGAGVLSLPWAMAKSGFVGGIGLLLLIALFSSLSMFFLIRAAHYSHRFTFPDLADFLSGASIKGPGFASQIPREGRSRWAETAVALCMLWYTFGVLLLYTVSLGELFHCILATLAPTLAESMFLSESAVKIYSGVFFFGLSCFESFKHLGPTSFIALAIIIYTLIIMVIRYFDPLSVSNPEAKHHVNISHHVHVDSSAAHYSVIDIGLLRAAPAVSLAYCMHYNVPVFYQQLRNRTPKRMLQVAACVILTVMAIYLIVALFGYLTWGSVTEDIVVLMYIFPPRAFYSYPTTSDVLKGHDIAFIVATFGIVAHFIFVYPLIAIACRKAFMHLADVVAQTVQARRRRAANTATVGSRLLAGGRGSSYSAVKDEISAGDETAPSTIFTRHPTITRIGVTFLIVSLCVAVACVVKCVSVVLVFNGATCGVFIVYIFPALLGLAVESHPGIRASAFLTIAFGLVISFGGVALQIKNMVQDGAFASCSGACSAFLRNTETPTPPPHYPAPAPFPFPGLPPTQF